MAYLAASDSRAFAWGEHDCVLFAAGAVEAMTGVDPAAGHRGSYGSNTEAALKLIELDRGVPEELVASLYPEVAPELAQIGDLAVVPGRGWGALGVVTGATIAVLRPEGRATLPLIDPATGRPTAARVFRP